MRAVARRREGTEAPFKFVVNVGDNFYPNGVRSPLDTRWQSSWEHIYHSLPPMSWYSVYGNHDYGEIDLPCACSGRDDIAGTQCAQVQKHGAVASDQAWHMPSMSHYMQPLPGVPLEIVTLDMNVVDASRICPWIACGKEKCTDPNATQAPGCTYAVCHETLQARAEEAWELLVSRVAAAKQATPRRHLIVNSHYPTTWLWWWRFKRKSIANILYDPDVHITFFGGHIHATDNVTNVRKQLRRHGWNDFCVGGGGGWACDNAFTPMSQGFVTGQVRSDGSISNLEFEMEPDDECCELNPRHHDPPSPPPPPT